MSAKSFLLKALLFILVPLPFAYGLHHVVTKGLLLSHNSYYGVWNDLRGSQLETTKLYIMGSSRARVQFSTSILDSVLHTDSYNLGLDGYQFSMIHHRVQTALRYNPKPACIVMVMDLFSLEDRPDLYEYQQFLPYLDDTATVRATQQYKGHFNWFQQHVPLYRYNSEGFLLREGIRNYLKGEATVHTESIKNYGPQALSWDSTFSAYKKARPNGVVQLINPVTQARFVQFLRECQAQRIKLVLVYPPDYYEFQPMVRNRPQILGMYAAYARQYGALFLDYSTHSLTRSRQYYYNSQHLNKSGAEIFSRDFSRDLTAQLDAVTLRSLRVP